MKISDKKKQKISEQILSYLYSIAPRPAFTSHIAQELARDEEFIKKLLIDLKNKNLLIEVKKNSKGIQFLRRSRWRLTDLTYQAYKQHQE